MVENYTCLFNHRTNVWKPWYFTLTWRGSPLESDVYRRQILTTKGDPRAVRVKYQGFQTFVLWLNKHVWFSTTWSCGSRKRDTTLREWKYKYDNLSGIGLRLLLIWNILLCVASVWSVNLVTCHSGNAVSPYHVYFSSSSWSESRFSWPFTLWTTLTEKDWMQFTARERPSFKIAGIIFFN